MNNCFSCFKTNTIKKIHESLKYYTYPYNRLLKSLLTNQNICLKNIDFIEIPGPMIRELSQVMGF